MNSEFMEIDPSYRRLFIEGTGRYIHLLVSKVHKKEVLDKR